MGSIIGIMIGFAITGLVMLLLIPIINKQNQMILKNLNKLKNTYFNENKIELLAKGRMIIVILMIVLIMSLSPVLFIKIDNIKVIIELMMFSIFIIVISILIIYITINKSIYNIKLENKILSISFSKNSLEYKLDDISDIKLLHVPAYRSSYLFLFIKKKGKEKYERFNLSYYNIVNIIALIVLTNSIKQKDLSIIETLEVEDIKKIREEIQLKNSKNIEYEHIV